VPKTVVTAWHGTYLVEDGRTLASVLPPTDPVALADRARRRREGSLTPEESELIADPEASGAVTDDRRLAEHGIRLVLSGELPAPPPNDVADRAMLRVALIADAERAIVAAWDPSIHVEEAVRAAADLDRVGNLLGERLGSWISRDIPDVDPGDHERAARAALEDGGRSEFGPSDPALRDARRRLAELFRSIAEARAALDRAVAAALPARAPNLTALLGADLAARLLAQAGGIDRLARLPASTVQVLGAEAAFFEHLRGRAPPPRHGLLFLHPAIQSAPRRDRGRLARTLAGKAAIAARLDRGGAPVDASLSAAFEARRVRLSAERAAPRSGGARRGSRKPFHRAARDR
jgi:nucleolar protein 56